MISNRSRRLSSLKLAYPILLVLIPLLGLSSSVATPTQAALPVLGLSPIQAGQSSALAQQSVLVMRIYFRDAAERDRLATEIGAEEASTRGGFLTKWGDLNLYNSLLTRGLRVEIDQEATRQANAYFAGDDSDTFYNGYRTVEEMQAFLDQKVAAYPLLAEKIDIGDSWCKTHLGMCTQPNSWSGFDLYVLHITNRNIPGPKPVFWYDAGIHSREIATPEVAMRFINYLLDNYDSNADAHWLVDYQDIWVMPMLNPDGHHMNESNGQGTPTLHRRNADKDDGCSTYDQFGTDINRNFPFQWGCCGGSSPNPCDDVYRGPSQNSEEETQSMIARVRALIPDQRGPLESDPAPLTTTGTLINMHSNAQQNLYPWGYTSNFAPNRTDLRNIGRHMSSPNVQPVGNGYEYCQNTECLYIVDGDEKNWAYGELGIPAYSLELSGANFFPPYNCLDNAGCTSSGLGIWPENRGALLHHSKIARTPYLLTRGPDANTVATSPMTVTQGTSSQLTASLNYNWMGSDGQVNAYLQNIAAAEYYIDTPPWAGGTGIPMAPTDGTFNSPTEGAQATIDTSSIPVGRHIIFVRGRGVTDYGGFQSWGPITAEWLTVTAGGSPTPTSTPFTPTAIPTNTTGPSATNTTIPPTATRTRTSTATTVPPSATAISTATVIPPTATSTNTPMLPPPPTSAATSTSTATATSTACAITFTDVPPDSTFYTWIRCLACRGIISGYTDGTFQPGNDITRGQIAKMVSNSAGFNEDPGPQIYEDVPEASPFYAWINRLSMRGHMGGYPCGLVPEETCEPPDNRPYFRPNASATRGQLAKIVSNAAGLGGDPTGLFYTDVPDDHTFYVWIMRLTTLGVMSGYPCGTIPEEPCDEESRPYFRPFSNVTRGQASKIVANTFFPGCETPSRP
ncbi:MAG TPA: M14 family zinc carboxypeptidase [Chloroflexia bacterium]|nr:M14 family zinc carboxypeptidase [Chloroflexia bacterium]